MVNLGKELVFTSEPVRQTIDEWFWRLQWRNAVASPPDRVGRNWCTVLRHCESPYGAMTTEGYRWLAQELMTLFPLSREDLLALAIFTCVAAYIPCNLNDKSFAAQLGEKGSGERRCLSQLCFHRLQQASCPEEFCQQLIRAAKLRGQHGINVISLADGVFLWMREWLARTEQRDIDIMPFQRNSVRWAYEYYQSGLSPSPQGQKDFR